MSKRIVGYVISHSGKPGGPWEAFVGGVGVATIVKKGRSRFKPTTRIQAAYLLASVRQVHPAARILRLVRRERHIAEETAVVEAALRYDTLRLQFEHHFLARTDGGPTAGDLSDADNCTRNACAALRAKRGGK